MLAHYQIHMLHHDPQSVTLLAVFAFVCEAMVGIPPSVALPCHFFSLRLTDPSQCSGCVSFQAMAATAGAGRSRLRRRGPGAVYSGHQGRGSRLAFLWDRAEVMLLRAGGRRRPLLIR